MQIIKPTANVISLTTANTVYNSPVVYLSATTTTLVTVASGGANVSSFVVPANQYIYVQKGPTDTIAANAAIFATAASYRG